MLCDTDRSMNPSPDNTRIRWLEECEGFTVHATFESDGNYLDGARDGEHCIVNDINRSTQSATAIFDDGDRHERMPAVRFKPELPGVDDYGFLFVGDVKRKGQIVKVAGKDSDTNAYHGHLVSTQGSTSLDLVVAFEEHTVVKIEY